jgi:hypothetical protein
VAAADEFLEGDIEVCAVPGLCDTGERLARVQDGEELCAGEAVQ